YNVKTDVNTLVSHLASDQGAGYQTTLSDGTSGILSDPDGTSASGLASLTTSVSISADGKFVTYVSTAAHLASGQQPTAVAPGFTPANVFVYDRTSDTNYLVSHQFGSATTAGDNTCYVAVISRDGTTIAFTSQDTNLVSGQTINPAYPVG